MRKNVFLSSKKKKKIQKLLIWGWHDQLSLIRTTDAYLKKDAGSPALSCVSASRTEVPEVQHAQP